MSNSYLAKLPAQIALIHVDLAGYPYTAYIHLISWLSDRSSYMLCTISFAFDICLRNTCANFDSRRQSMSDSFLGIPPFGVSIGLRHNLFPLCSQWPMSTGFWFAVYVLFTSLCWCIGPHSKYGWNIMIRPWSEKSLHPVSCSCACRAMIPLPTSGGRPGWYTLVLASVFDTPPNIVY